MFSSYLSYILSYILELFHQIYLFLFQLSANISHFSSNSSSFAASNRPAILAVSFFLTKNGINDHRGIRNFHFWKLLWYVVFTWIQHKRWFGRLKYAFIAWYNLALPLVPNVQRLPISHLNLISVLGNVKYDLCVFFPFNNTGPNKTGYTPDKLIRSGYLKVMNVTLWPLNWTLD